MHRITLVAAVCTILSACATTQPPKPDTVPPELVPAGYSAADCHIVKPAEAITDDTSKVSHGEHAPHVECIKHTQGAVVQKITPTCHTVSGTALPLEACCLRDDGSAIPDCVPKSIPKGQ
jgi:hypothetical protein